MINCDRNYNFFNLKDFKKHMVMDFSKLIFPNVPVFVTFLLNSLTLNEKVFLFK